MTLLSLPVLPVPLARGLKESWLLDPSIVFLNHGSFGACPRAVLARQDLWREQMEARPIEFLDRRLDALLAEARQPFADFLRCDRDDFAFITNATSGVNAVLRSLRLEPGDQLLTTNHVYPAVRQTMRHLAERAGGEHVEVRVDLPVRDAEQVVNAIASALTPRTRLVIMDHVTSPTALVFPAAAVAALCAQRGVDLLIDGAHAPGMVDLDLRALNPAYYTANLHKWVCAPKGAAVLWARSDRQEGLHPTTLSHYVGQGFRQEFAWQGTRDVTAWLTAPGALMWMEAFDWSSVRAHNHALAVWAQAMLCQRWNVEPISPLDGSMLGSMASIPLPMGVERYEDARVFKMRLYDEHRIEVPVFEFEGRWLLRVSCQLYNEAWEYERLADAVLTLAR